VQTCNNKERVKERRRRKKHEDSVVSKMKGYLITIECEEIKQYVNNK